MKDTFLAERTKYETPADFCRRLFAELTEIKKVPSQHNITGRTTNRKANATITDGKLRVKIMKKQLEIK